MHGNVWEWCTDTYLQQLSGGLDPRGPKKGTDRGRIIRGGSWLSYAKYCRSAMRQAHHDLNSAPYLGIRIVLKKAPRNSSQKNEGQYYESLSHYQVIRLIAGFAFAHLAG